MTEIVRPHVLFLCTANYYRSRYAEARFLARAAALGLAWSAGSRGLDLGRLPPGSGPISIHTRARLELHGVDVAPHLREPRLAGPTDFEEAALTIAMLEREHRPMLAVAAPGWVDRIRYWRIEDVPPGDDYDPLHEIDHQLDLLLDELAARVMPPAAG